MSQEHCPDCGKPNEGIHPCSPQVKKEVLASRRRAQRHADKEYPERVAIGLGNCADDPMWATHAEVSKNLLQRAKDVIFRLHAENKELKVKKLVRLTQGQAFEIWRETGSIIPMCDHWLHFANAIMDAMEAKNT